MNCGVCVYLLELCLLFIVPIILVVACVAGRFYVIAGTCNGRILAFLYQLAWRWQRWLLVVVIFLICPVAVNLMTREKRNANEWKYVEFWRNPLLSARCQWPWYNNRIPGVINEPTILRSHSYFCRVLCAKWMQCLHLGLFTDNDLRGPEQFLEIFGGSAHLSGHIWLISLTVTPIG